MLCARIDGKVLAVYDRETKTQDGKFQRVRCVDLYVGHDLIKVSKIPDSVSFGAGESVEGFPIKVYNGQYGLSCVYNEDAEGV